MITPNTDSTFTQVKSENPRTFAWQNSRLVEVTEMTTLSTMKKTGAPSGTVREERLRKEMGELDDLLLKAVDETFIQIFKEAGAKVIYNYLENKCHLKSEQFWEKPDAFSDGLKRLMVSGALVMEKMILENLYAKLELKFAEKEGYEFSDYIRELKKLPAQEG